jgi:hypothetical protein
MVTGAATATARFSQLQGEHHEEEGYALSARKTVP